MQLYLIVNQIKVEIENLQKVMLFENWCIRFI